MDFYIGGFFYRWNFPQVECSVGGIFHRWNFPGGTFLGGTFLGGIFLGGIYLAPLIQLVYKHTDKLFSEFGLILNQIWIVITLFWFGAKLVDIIISVLLLFAESGIILAPNGIPLVAKSIETELVLDQFNNIQKSIYLSVLV